ncbi:isoleucine--tRNA ligase [Buchnera aphidicola]|uniref:Isoleucine--tRNA ligase n=1 Tax=Buchnera aphidicola (Cinara curvipes) TaxID=2518975 RepID=A0A451D6Q7_9GAMM|nr:isoleucine--tRNA ligase [Buchnera aphidicola]VFP81394.1 Isoleucine--tRNA ligase [Buchnera aphidicola (Cinara curvipes)]
MKNIKKSLNLPKTTFPMKANLAIKEIEILKKWKKDKLYKNLSIKNKKNKYFFLHDGPPYANGDIHIGHAVNKILKDIILKFKRMSGFFAPYTPCWDCHGLPIEQKVEKIFAEKITTTNVEKFRELCHKYVLQQVQQQKKDFIRLGILADWKNASLTIDYKNQANTINVLTKIVKKGYVYRDLKPIHWCFKCQSSLAEAEIEHKIKNSISIYILFKIKNYNLFKKFFKKKIQKEKKFLFKISVIIFTTTPWTLPTCQAIAVNPNLYYQIIQIKKRYYICEEKLTKNIINKIKIKKWKIIGLIKGKKLENLECLHPFFNIYVPIILSTHVSDILGTGAVHMSPDHGYEDFIACKKYKIKPLQIVNSYGFYNIPTFKKLNNIHIFNKENIIIQLLQNNKKIFFSEIINHSYPHCWRHNKPVIFRTTPQWFIKISDESLKNKILKEIKKVSWIPLWGGNKMKKMLINRPDWCISRQRTWGIPIPFFIHKNTGKLHPNTILIMKKVEKKIKKYGSQIWWKTKKKKWLKKDADMYEKVNDVLDVWFESGSNHQLKIYKYNLINRFNYIADLYLEGSDQHRGWFMSSLITSVITKKYAPYLSVITHGFVINKYGQKMSKSLEKNIKPKDIIQKWGADILRLWVAYTNYTNDISISNKILEQISSHYRRIRNTIRFLFSNIFDFESKIHIIKNKKMLLLDRWILEITYKYQKKIIKNYSNYNFHKVVQIIINFCSTELGSCYLELIKDRQYTMHRNSIERRSSQTTIFYILQSLIRWISPILSFTAEEAWNQLKDKKESSIFKNTWFKKIKPLPENITYNSIFWKKIFTIKNEVNKFIEKEKKNKYINSSLEIQLLLYVDKKLFRLLLSLNTELKFIFLVSETRLHRYSSAPKFAYHSQDIKNLKIIIKKSNKIKCPRCWNYSKKNTLINNNMQVCYRCISNINQKTKKHIFL